MKKILLTLSLFLLSINVFAQEGIPDNTVFNIKNINQQFDQINKKITQENISLETLTAEVDHLEQLHENGKDCVEKSQDQLKKLDELLSSKEFEASLKLGQADYQYLKDKQIFYVKQMAECRLFLYRSQEELVKYKDKIKVLSTYQILKQEVPIWKYNQKQFSTALGQLDIEKFFPMPSLAQLSTKKMMVGVFLLIFTLSLAIYLRHICRHWLNAKHTDNRFLIALIATIATFIIPLVFITTVAVFFYSLSEIHNTVSNVERLCYGLLSIVFLWALSKFVLNPPLNAENPFGLTPYIARLLYIRWMLLLLWLLLGGTVWLFLSKQIFLPEVIILVRTIFIIPLSILVFWFLWGVLRHPRVKKRNHTLVLFIKILLLILFVVVVVAELLGFHQLASFVIVNTIKTAVILITGFALWCLVDFIHGCLDNTDHRLSQKIHYILGVKFNRRLTELYILKYIAYFLIIFFSIILFLDIWRISANFIDVMMDGFISGIAISGLVMSPSRIVIGLFVFAILSLFGRFIATLFTRKYQFEGEEETQVAVASIIMYIIFSLALLLGLLIMGVNFTGLAIIAGALSVGVGLGLQHIAENIVSGFLLLFDKTLKPGDRVVVGKTEGFIKKIRLRSTQITTLSKEDVIVPNADLITNQVTNYMFRNRYWRLVCRVGVAYGSDIERVRDTLLNVANENQEVIQDGKNKPTVIFHSFGESSLDFELWCVIYDVNKKYTVLSDLNFAINKAFKENQIEIAFPRRDIHIHQQNG